MATPFFIAEAPTVTILRSLASSAYGSYTLNLPDDIELEDVTDLDAPGNTLGYVASLQRGKRVGGLARSFIRADVTVTATDPSDLDVTPESDVHDVLDEARARVSSDFFLESDITKAGMGAWIPYVDFNVGDRANISVLDHVVNLPITRIESQVTDHSDTDFLVHVGGQLVSDEQARMAENMTLEKKFLQDRRELAGIEAAAKHAQKTAEDAKQIAEQSKEASDAALTATRIEYAVGDSEEFPPVSGWSVLTPQRPSGSFIWMRTRITYGSGQSEVTSPVLVTGNTGAPGADGTDGTAGKDGLGIQSTVVSYAVGPSGTVAPTSGWSDQVPPLTKGQYLWTRTVWTYTDNSTETGHSVSYIAQDGNDGDDGLPGKDGVGIASTVHLYAVSSSGTVAPTSGWVSTPPAAQPGQFMWTRTIWTYTDGTTETGHAIGKIGDTGQPGRDGIDGIDGQDGLPGRDGLGLKTTTVSYAVHTSGTVAPTSGWTSQVPTLVQGHYLWTRTTWTYTDNSTETGYSVTYLSKDGNDGEDGLPGKDGVGITDTAIVYAVSSSGTSTPTSGWVATPPAAQPGQWIWTRTTWTYSDGTTETGYSVGKVGDTGDKGDKGDPGDKGDDGLPGKDGVGLSLTALAYSLSTSGTSSPTTGWTTTVPTLVKGRYLWTRTTWTYTDNSTEVGFSVAYVGTDGSDGEDGLPGKDGVGIKSTTITYAKSASGTTPPTTGWGAQPPVTSPGDFVWTRTVWGYDDNTTETGYSVGKIGNTGAPGRDGLDGEDGLPGKDGVGLSSTLVEYALHTSGTIAPASGWSTTVPTLVKGRYLWTRTMWTYTDDSTETGHSVSYIPTDGSDGEDGLPGKDGVGITGTTITYAKSSSGTTTPTSGWASQPPVTSPGDYVWTRTVWSYSDGTTETGYSVGRIGLKGDKGDPGSAGKGISSTETAYASSASGTTTPTAGWTTSIPVVPKGHFLWTRTTLTFTDGATSVSYAVSRQGVDGENGTPGNPGADGRTSYFHTAYANSSDGVAGFSTTDPTGRTYVGTYSDFTEADSTDPSRYTWQLVKGADGAPGKGVDTVTITYASSSSGTQAPTTGWQTTMPPVPQGHFLWTRTLTRFTDGASTTVDMVARQGVDGEKGTPGVPGHDGRTPFLHVAYANSPDGTVDFSTTDPSGRAYLGTYSDYATLDIYFDVYADSYGTSTPLDSTDPARYSWALIKGTDGIDGTDGTDGISITAVDVYFRQVPKGSAAPAAPTTLVPTGWSTTEPPWAGDQDLWQTSRIRYSSGDFAYTPPSKVGAYDAANAAWAAATDADGELQKKVKAAQDAATAAEGAFEDVDDLINAPEGDFRQGVAAAFWAQDQVNDEQSEFNQAVSQTATNALATSRLAFPHVSITPADSAGRPYWSYGASSSTLTPDKSSIAGDLSTYSWSHTGAIPGSTVAEAYFDVTPGIDLKLNLMTYMSSGSISAVYVGFVDETGANAVEQWKDLSTSGGVWFESAEMSFPTVVEAWTPGVGIFRLKPGVKKARPVVRTLTAITVWGMHLAAWFPLAEDLQAETAARLDSLEELRGVRTEVTRLDERVAELESGEDFRHLGARRGRLVRDTGYVNISWPSDKRATFTWVAGENLDVTFRINYENNTVIEDSFNTVEDFLGQWSMSLGSDSGSTNIRSASATYRRKPGQVSRFSQTAPQQSIPKSTWFQPSGTSDTGVTGPMGWSAGSTPVRMIATLEVEWRWATAHADYGIAWFVNGVDANHLVQTNLGPRWFWEDGRRTQKLEFSGTLPPNAVLTPALWSSSGGSESDANQRLITFAKAEYFTIT
ncbi:hypothetical protein CDES_07510 [Corynebacterium deserti GIMN1.010]|uniref:Uncharacterized protein n=1 Tax=Corynebacterium deserti GIMN1.010 TaxID=931089 RepID=A0A0M5IR59_9CORY|nr:hypothetical protein [Corynebacterium deserti]ALC05911.1 hypothetical protein CDES_07510 [Corynebacterium deserti GIMN1.010]